MWGTLQCSRVSGRCTHLVIVFFLLLLKPHEYVYALAGSENDILIILVCSTLAQKGRNTLGLDVLCSLFFCKVTNAYGICFCRMALNVARDHSPLTLMLKGPHQVIADTHIIMQRCWMNRFLAWLEHKFEVNFKK